MSSLYVTESEMRNKIHQHSKHPHLLFNNMCSLETSNLCDVVVVETVNDKKVELGLICLFNHY